MTWFFSGGQPLRANIRFKTIGKILCIVLRGNYMPGCQFSRSPQLQGKVSNTETCFSHLEATSREFLRMREINKMPMNLRIASWQSLMMVYQRLKLCQQNLNLWVRVMQSMYSLYELRKRKIIGLNCMRIGKISIFAPIV